MSQIKSIGLFSLVTSFSFFSQANPEPWQTNMTQSITEVGQEIFDIHMLIFLICVITGVLVFGFMLFVLIRYRKSNGQKPATFHDNPAVELTWTIIPAVILLAMAWPASMTMMRVYDTKEADMDILVTGYQWKWKYEYLTDTGENVSFFSSLSTPNEQIGNEDPKNPHYLLQVDNPLVLPVGKKIRFLVTANDVIHSWWVPDLAVKKDAIPGFINETWSKPMEVGLFRGQCAELCGKHHGFMPIVVDVRPEDEFVAWLDAEQQRAAQLAQLTTQTFSMQELIKEGKRVYKKNCAVCHGAQGEGGIGKAIVGSPIAMGDKQQHIDVLVNGIAGSAMQSFSSQLSELEIAAVITYQRNGFGNNMGDSVQPIEIFNYKQQ